MEKLGAVAIVCFSIMATAYLCARLFVRSERDARLRMRVWGFNIDLNVTRSERIVCKSHANG